MRRRDFITTLGSAAVWPLTARAQQPQMKRVGVLIALAADEPESRAWMAGFLQGLQELGWAVGRNVQIESRFGAADAEHIRTAGDRNFPCIES
jgi:putative tryptophan/tyrosine transport system substrate-binding protein